MSIFDRIKGAIWGKKAEQKAQTAATQTTTAKPASRVSASASSTHAGGSTQSQPQVAQAPAPSAPGSVVGGSATSPAPAANSATPHSSPPSPAPANSSANSSAFVDVEAILDAAVKANGQKLDWRHSIVDTMKALGMESSLSERKELADELGYTGDKSDSATMNIWLQKALMKKLAEHGGKVPANLMD